MLLAAPVPASASRRTEAYEALAALGLRDPRLVLSGAECAELEERAGEWLARDADAERFAYVMTAGLPPSVHSPVGLVRRRPTDTLPPLRSSPAEPVTLREPVPARLRPECVDCGRPGTPDSLPGGLCRPYRAEPAPLSRGDGLPGVEVRRWASLVRDGLTRGRPPTRPRT